ncbi:hypothetical protein GGR88_002763 [Sphingomonas jejuensis]|uniref:GH25 family protein n=1 Tax=Sphingomonas jejuensis TaxID=904715 RepID=A0ABX0XPE0_9SPHN|nr:DUF4198 domain-containing protein [Sphingomonas jejuensis]NJC35249.1 hypothetical protein [Sphingomonas jejuensis]
MVTKTLLALLMLGTAAAASAHEVWIERDGAGPARIYLGEPAEPLPPGGDPEFAKLRQPRLVPASTAEQVRRAGFIEVAVPAGDVRAWDDNVFAPWGEDGAREGVIYYARAGRAEPRHELPFEIVPAAANGDRFTVLRDGRPAAGTDVTLVAPDRSTSTLKTDAAGTVTVTPQVPGRYLLVAAVAEDGSHTLPGGTVQKLHRITTTSFVQP